MAALPVVAIIGKPNTGKSTLFNRLAGRRRALVSATAGTTRDHVVQRIPGRITDFLLLDTGGIGGGTTDHDFERDVTAQSVIAMAAADVILFTVDARDELTGSDHAVIALLRKRKRSHVPVILVATKCDNPAIADERIPEWYGLNIAEDVIAVSALHRIGTDELEEAIQQHLQSMHFVPQETKLAERDVTLPRIAIVGKPNVGKSSVVNALMSDPQRTLSARLVSNIPGTTRDSSDSVIRFHDRDYVFADTAGLRRKARVDEDLETLSAIKALQAVEDCDIVILVLDATDIISRQDKRIAHLAMEEGKGLIILLNKSDCLTAAEREEKKAETRAAFPFCRFAPLLPVSAHTREGLAHIFPQIDTIERNRSRRIPTKELLRWYEEAIRKIPARALTGKFITQAEDIPPTFVLFVRKPKDVDVSQLRYLENSLRTTFAFEGTPIRWITKEGSPRK